MKTLLHVGCGGNTLRQLPLRFQDGSWDEVRYDIDPSVQPDIVGRLQDMSLLEDGSVDAVYSSHNIEHVWAFEVPVVLAEFHRVLSDEGFAMILCPDMQAVAEAVAQGQLEETLYVSPAGPISAMDIIYGFQSSIQAGNHFMAHKTAFTAPSLARHLLSAGFAGIDVVRDHVYGLHAVAYKHSWSSQAASTMSESVLPAVGGQVRIERYGRFDET